MGEWLHGDFTLSIRGIRKQRGHNPNKYTARYNAEVLQCPAEPFRIGTEVSVRMLHYGRPKDFDFFTKPGHFDGDENDIQTQNGNIKLGRKSKTFPNPFV
jgi:hypothetical protein